MQARSSGEVRIGEVRVVKLRPTQGCPAEINAAQVGAREILILQVLPRELILLERYWGEIPGSLTSEPPTPDSRGMASPFLFGA